MHDTRSLSRKIEDACWALVLSGLTVGFVAGLCLGQMLGAWGRD